MREKISQFTIAIQNQDRVPLWAISNDSVIYYLATNQSYHWKNRSKIVFWFVRITRFIKSSDCAIMLFGVYRIILLWVDSLIKHFFKKGMETKKYNKIIVGHGANAESFLVDHFFKDCDAILKINNITKEGVDKIGLPSIFRMLLLLIKNFGISKKIIRLSDMFKINPNHFLTVAAINISEYVFFREIWRLALKKGVNEVVFLALHISAHSCKDENLKIHYYSHGLIKLSIPMIKPDYIQILTLEEQQYFQKIFSNTVRCDVIKQSDKISNKKNDYVLFISPEDALQMSKDIQKTIYSFLSWAILKKLKIIYRPSPKYPHDSYEQFNEFYKSYQGELDMAIIDFDKKLSILKPKFVVGFFFNRACNYLNDEYYPD